jgi:hypothetical protein
MSNLGYLNWGVDYLLDVPVFAGFSLDCQFGSLEWTHEQDGNVIRMLSGSTVKQTMWSGWANVVNLKRHEFKAEMQLVQEEVHFRLQRVMDMVARSAQWFFPGIWLEDIWVTTGCSSGHTEWYIPRYFPYDVVTQANYTPLVWLSDWDNTLTSQTVVTSGTPSTNEVKILDGVESCTIETPDLSAHDGMMIVRYPPKFYINEVEMEYKIEEENDLNLSLEMKENVIGRPWS